MQHTRWFALRFLELVCTLFLTEPLRTVIRNAERYPYALVLAVSRLSVQIRLKCSMNAAVCCRRAMRERKSISSGAKKKWKVRKAEEAGAEEHRFGKRVVMAALYECLLDVDAAKIDRAHNRRVAIKNEVDLHFAALPTSITDALPGERVRERLFDDAQRKKTAAPMLAQVAAVRDELRSAHGNLLLLSAGNQRDLVLKSSDTTIAQYLRRLNRRVPTLFLWMSGKSVPTGRGKAKKHSGSESSSSVVNDEQVLLPLYQPKRGNARDSSFASGLVRHKHKFNFSSFAQAVDSVRLLRGLNVCCSRGA